MKRVLIIGVLAGACALAAGQPEAPPTLRPTTGRAPVAGNAYTPEERPKVTVDFKGGTLAEYAAAVRAAQPAANIVVTAEAVDVSVPAINLRDAEIFEAMGILNRLQAATTARQLSVSREGDVYVVNAIDQGRKGEIPRTQVWSVQGYLEGTKIEDLLSAIDAVIGTSGGTATIKFHRETGLLIARGTNSDLGAIEGTLNGLGLTNNANKWKDTGDLVRPLNDRVTVLEGRLRDLEKRVPPVAPAKQPPQ